MPTISPPSKLKQARTQFTLEFTSDETSAAETGAIQRLGASINVPGFRPGKAPLEQLKSRMKPEAILDEVIRGLLPTHMGNLLKEHTLKPIIPPSVEVTSASPLTVKLTFVEKPEVTLKGLDKITIEKTPPKVEEKDVQRMVDYILEQYKSVETVDRAAAEGDQVTMDFVGVDEEKREIEGTRSSGYQVRIGSKTLIPGFEDQLKGLKKGEEKSFQITFPEKYHAEHLRGKPATFTVKVTDVSQVTLPTLTDDFAKNTLRAESAADFRTKIQTSMREQEESLDRQKREEKFLTALTDATQVDLADELIEREIHAILHDLEHQLEDSKTTLEEWLKQTSRTPEQFQKEIREQAARRLRLRFGMEKALEEKQIALNDEEKTGTEEEQWRRRVEKFLDEMLA